MAKATTAITMYRGDSYPITLTLTDKTTKAAIDLTGCSLTMTVDTLSAPPDDTTKVFEVAGVLSATPTDGRATFVPTSEDTSTVGTLYYDIQLTDADGNVRTVAKDKFTVAQDITK